MDFCITRQINTRNYNVFIDDNKGNFTVARKLDVNENPDISPDMPPRFFRAAAENKSASASAPAAEIVNHAWSRSPSPANMASTFRTASAVSCRRFCEASKPEAYWLVCMGLQEKTQKLEEKREKTGIRIRPCQPFFRSKSRKAAKAPSMRKIVHTTENEPTCESFKIFCRVARSRRDKMASQQSMKPSR